MLPLRDEVRDGGRFVRCRPPSLFSRKKRRKKGKSKQRKEERVNCMRVQGGEVARKRYKCVCVCLELCFLRSEARWFKRKTKRNNTRERTKRNKRGGEKEGGEKGWEREKGEGTTATAVALCLRHARPAFSLRGRTPTSKPPKSATPLLPRPSIHALIRFRGECERLGLPPFQVRPLPHTALARAEKPILRQQRP